MPEEKDIGKEVRDLLNKHGKAKNDSTTPEMSKSVKITGNGNIAALRDINVNTKKIIRPKFTPGAEHITDAQAKKIKDTIDAIVDTEFAGGMSKQAAYAKWWGTLKNRFNIPSYRLIPSHLFDESIRWLKQQKAINRPKKRKNDKVGWRNEYYSGIYARIKDLGISKGELYDITNKKLGVHVSTLKNLSDKNLKKLHSIIFSMKIPKS